MNDRDERTNNRLMVSLVYGALWVSAEVPTKDIFFRGDKSVEVTLSYVEGSEDDIPDKFSVYVSDDDDWAMDHRFATFEEAQRKFLWLVSHDYMTWETLKTIEDHYVPE